MRHPRDCGSVSPVARSSSRARSAKPSAPDRANSSSAEWRCTRARARWPARRRRSPYARCTRARSSGHRATSQITSASAYACSESPSDESAARPRAAATRAGAWCETVTSRSNDSKSFAGRLVAAGSQVRVDQVGLPEEVDARRALQFLATVLERLDRGDDSSARERADAERVPGIARSAAEPHPRGELERALGKFGDIGCATEKSLHDHRHTEGTALPVDQAGLDRELPGLCCCCLGGAQTVQGSLDVRERDQALREVEQRALATEAFDQRLEQRAGRLAIPDVDENEYQFDRELD